MLYTLPSCSLFSKCIDYNLHSCDRCWTHDPCPSPLCLCCIFCHLPGDYRGSAGIANITSTVAETGIVDKQDVATVLGGQQVLSSIEYAIGGALAGGVWIQYLPKRLAKHITSPYDEYGALNALHSKLGSSDEGPVGRSLCRFLDADVNYYLLPHYHCLYLHVDNAAC
jgi:hypothetical protein